MSPKERDTRKKMVALVNVLGYKIAHHYYPQLVCQVTALLEFLVQSRLTIKRT